MYEVKGKYWMVRDGVRQPAAPTRRFHTAMGMLRWALDNRMIRRGAWGNSAPGPREMERVSVPYAGSCDWSGDYSFTPEQVAAMGRALSRYRAHLHYWREVEPGWETVRRIAWADNSVDLVQHDRYGNKRMVQEVAPHGDACF